MFVKLTEVKKRGEKIIKKERKNQLQITITKKRF